MYTDRKQYDNEYDAYERRGELALGKAVEIALLVALLGALMGFALSRAGDLNSGATAGQAHWLSIETRILEAKLAFDQRQRQISLERQQAITQLELRWRERWSETAEAAASWAVLALVLATIALAFGAASCLVCLGIARLKATPAPQVAAERQRAEVIRVPIDRTRV